MKYELMIKDRSRRSLEVVQELPDKGDVFATVILLSGFGTDLHEFGFFDDVSTALVQNKIQTIRFSYAGLGKSHGDFSKANIEDMVTQYEDIFEYVLHDRFTDPKKIGVLAHQFGATLALAAKPSEYIKSYIFTGALSDPEDTISRWFRRQRGFDPNGVSTRDRADRTKTKIGSDFWRSSRRFNFKALARKCTTPVLFIHGGRDQYVKGHQAYELYESIAGPKKFQLIEKADHGFTREYRNTAINLITQRFVETLNP